MNLRIQAKTESKLWLNGKLSELFDAYLLLQNDTNRNSIDGLKKENHLLYEIAKTTLLFIRAVEIAESEIPNGAGAPTIDQNQEILESAYNKYWDLYERAPTEPEWYAWLEQEKYNPKEKYIVAANTRFTRTKNGWGKAKVKKDLAKFKSIEFQMWRLLEKIHSTN